MSLRRPRSHRLETESEAALKRALPSRFVYRRSDPDYGIDGEIEEFGEDDCATGLRFPVQLKGTDKKGTRALALRLSLDHATYYRSLTLPVLMVRYRSADDALFVRWFHEFDSNVSRTGLTFRWEEEDRWREDTPERLVAGARAFLELRSARVTVPVPFYLDVDAAGRLGVSDREIALAIRAAADRRRDILRVQFGEPPAGSARIEVRADRVTASLAGVASGTLHLGKGYPVGEHGERLAVDAWTLAAQAFERLGQSDLAARLAREFFASSSLADYADIAGVLSGAMARAGRVREALEVSARLDEDEREAAAELSHLFILPAVAATSAMSDEDVERHREVMRARIERRVARGALRDAGRQHFNLANHLRKSAEPQAAAEQYGLALERDPDYGDRTHFWAEYGGALFGSHRYDEAAAAYGRAADLGAERVYVGLRADALMWAGRYRDALDLFRELNVGSEAPGEGEWRLKARLLAAIVEDGGIARQNGRHARHPEAAAAAAAAVAEHGVSGSGPALEEVLRRDALCGFAWLGLAFLALEREERQVALDAFLAAGLLYEQDWIAAWTHALLLAVECGDESALVDGFEVAASCNPTGLVPALTALMDEYSVDAELREAFLELAEATFHQAAGREQPARLRLLGKNGSVEVVELGDRD